MSMSRKHFIQFANQLSEERPITSDNTIPFKLWVRCCKAVATVCNENNANFDRFRFLDACGVPDKYK